MTSSAAIPRRMSSRCASPFRSATTTCLGRRPGRRPSVKAMSINGTMVPRRLNTPMRNARDEGPVHHFLHFENREAKTFAAGAEHAVLALGKPLLGKNFAFQECAAIEFRGKRHVVALKGHQANLFTAWSSSSGVKGLVT